MLFSFTSAFPVLILLAGPVTATPISGSGMTIPLTRRVVNRKINNNGTADLNWIAASTEQIINKYHATLSAYEINTGQVMSGMSSIAERETMQLAKRAAAGEPLVDEQSGSFWQGSISIGTPAQHFNM